MTTQLEGEVVGAWSEGEKTYVFDVTQSGSAGCLRCSSALASSGVATDLACLAACATSMIESYW